MKIVAPLTEINDIDSLFNSGADELFFGYIPYSWINNYFNLLPLNGRERMYSNFSIHSLHEFDDLTMNSNIDKMSMTINGHYYNDCAYQEIIQLVEYAYNKGVKNFIIADVNLLILLKGHFRDVSFTISSDTGIYNSQAIKFLFKYGIKRDHFPQKNAHWSDGKYN